MRFSHEKITALRIGWNERPLTEADFHKLCRKHKITVEEMPLRVSGFYYSVMGRHFIAIDTKLSPAKKLFVMFHEFAHFLMHAPGHNATANFHGVGKPNRDEREADAFALVALIPRSWLETRTPDELIADEGITADMLRERVELFRRHGV
jgi:Zn-dependent peptidase ImmA (M78 family)